MAHVLLWIKKESFKRGDIRMLILTARAMLKSTFVDKNGKLQEGRYKRAGFYHDGYAPVQLDDDSYTFIDKNGKLQERRYIWAKSYSEGYAAVKLEDNRIAFIDTQGNIYETVDEWKEYISKHPEEYKHIPPHRFADKEFMDMINAQIKNVLTGRLEDLKEKYNQAESEEEREEIRKSLKGNRENIQQIMEMVSKKNEEVEEILRQKEAEFEAARAEREARAKAAKEKDLQTREEFEEQRSLIDNFDISLDEKKE